ncbi:THUMP domain-containing class I SAM-dependent RNA methyltransferase [Dinoroseobacter sp. S76]|uniref:THUMP domain-containing class I SAM-dependent RNA methyltransferase n=1 Tax=Dinoroseobacter sp. S76 TaxID=3415124 RepID=UPI003C7B4C7E
MTTPPFDLFLAAPPGLEPVLAAEAAAHGFPDPHAVPGGVETKGGWPDIWRANLHLRGAARVLVRLGSFRAFHLAQLDKRARKFPWGDVLRADIPVRVEATCRRSKIYHDRAAAQRVMRAITETLGAPEGKGDDAVRILVRIEDDLVQISLDTSGAPLHRRGHKEFVGKAPMRETLAALFLRQMGYDGREPLVDPMCGSGTFVIEAAEIALGFPPGRDRSFAFETLATADPDTIAGSRKHNPADAPSAEPLAFGFDRDDGAIRGARSNADRAGVSAATRFERQPISDLIPPVPGPGLVLVNPPYGARIGNRKLLFGLYGSLGKVLMEGFSGWRVGVITSDGGLAKATGLPFLPAGPAVSLGGLKVTLWRTDPLP